MRGSCEGGGGRAKKRRGVHGRAGRRVRACLGSVMSSLPSSAPETYMVRNRTSTSHAKHASMSHCSASCAGGTRSPPRGGGAAGSWNASCSGMASTSYTASAIRKYDHRRSRTPCTRESYGGSSRCCCHRLRNISDSASSSVAFSRRMRRSRRSSRARPWISCHHRRRGSTSSSSRVDAIEIVLLRRFSGKLTPLEAPLPGAIVSD